MSHVHVLKKSIAGVVLALAGILALPTPSAADPACGSALPLGLPAERRDHGSPGDGWFRFETFSPGLVAIAVTSPLDEPGEPWLEVRDGRCQPLESAAVGGRAAVYVDRGAAQAVVALPEPGEYFVRVAATDPRVPLGPYRLTVLAADLHLAAKAIHPLDDQPEPDPLTSGGPAKAIHPLDDQPEPDPLTSGGPAKAIHPLDDQPEPDPLTSGGPAKAIHPLDDQPEPDPLTSGGPAKAIHPLDDQPEPDPLRHPGTGRRKADLLEELCSAVAVDDHGDLPLCASSLPARGLETGELLNGWGDDRDYFRFVLSGMRTVEITATGECDPFAALYDHRGHRLTVDGGDGGSRIVKTLVPGSYSVRVEARDGAEGPYRLAVRVLE